MEGGGLEGEGEKVVSLIFHFPLLIKESIFCVSKHTDLCPV